MTKAEIGCGAGVARMSMYANFSGIVKLRAAMLREVSVHNFRVFFFEMCLRYSISKVDAQWELIEAIKNLRDEIAGWDINQCSMLYKVILAVVD
ncbi:hypothetical protein GQX43_00100 [Staphylococcus aureus]|nr:hypothetical protein [Staphylococcus aureus]